MSLGILGKKLGMTQVFAEDGKLTPVTVIEAGPCTLLQRRTEDKDGYNAFQVAFIEKKVSRANKPLLGHFKKFSSQPFREIREFRLGDGDTAEGLEPGKVLRVQDMLKVGDYVNITGVTKGRGFSGVIKRWGFRGGPSGHGSMFNRGPGSIGASAYPARVIKGKKMPGHYGNKRVKAKNLQVVAIREEDNHLIVKGAVPGSINGIVEVRKSK